MIKAFEEASGRSVPRELAGRRAGDAAAVYASPQVPVLGCLPGSARGSGSHSAAGSPGGCLALVLPGACPSSPVHPHTTHACACPLQLAEAELGWRARRSLHDMCADHWRWTVANPQGFLTKAPPAVAAEPAGTMAAEPAGPLAAEM